MLDICSRVRTIIRYATSIVKKKMFQTILSKNTIGTPGSDVHATHCCQSANRTHLTIANRHCIMTITLTPGRDLPRRLFREGFVKKWFSKRKLSMDELVILDRINR